MKEEAYLKFLKDVKPIKENSMVTTSEVNRIAGTFYQDLIDDVGEYVMDRFNNEEIQEKVGDAILARVENLLRHRPH
jgi:hypothetical protein